MASKENQEALDCVASIIKQARDNSGIGKYDIMWCFVEDCVKTLQKAIDENEQYLSDEEACDYYRRYRKDLDIAIDKLTRGCDRCSKKANNIYEKELKVYKKALKICCEYAEHKRTWYQVEGYTLEETILNEARNEARKELQDGK